MKLDKIDIFHSCAQPVVVAGPCSAESEEQVMQVAKELKENGVKIFRAGIWKPRTRPGCFEGVGKEGLPWLARVKRELGMCITTEVATAEHVEPALAAGVDILWIGARTTANPFAVQEIAAEQLARYEQDEIHLRLYTKDGKTLIQYAIGKTDTSFTIPDSVTSVTSWMFGENAFSSCPNLKELVVSSSNQNYKSVNGLLLTKDGKTLVVGINGNVTIPDSVTSIGRCAFLGCSGLTSITIPDGVTSIGRGAFCGFKALESVSISKSVSDIGSYAFYEWAKINISDWNKKISQNEEISYLSTQNESKQKNFILLTMMFLTFLLVVPFPLIRLMLERCQLSIRLLLMSMLDQHLLR